MLRLTLKLFIIFQDASALRINMSKHLLANPRHFRPSLAIKRIKQ